MLSLTPQSKKIAIFLFIGLTSVIAARVSAEDAVVIDTGDASSEVSIANDINTNVTDTGSGTPPETASSSTSDTGSEGQAAPNAAIGTGTDKNPTENGDTGTTNGNADRETGITTIMGANDAVAANTVAAAADTGSNTLADAGLAVIETGNAAALANVVNVLNATIIDSDGLLLFLNRLGASSGHIDLRKLGLFATTTENDGAICGSCVAANRDFASAASNTAALINDIAVNASTGANVIRRTRDGAIETGDAYAAANVVNAVNTTITDSEYLLLTFNNFGDWRGDIVFPGKKFFESWRGRNPAISGKTDIGNTNDASITNNLQTEAASGGNAAGADRRADVKTGDSRASASVLSAVNQNFTGGNTLNLLVRVSGKWAGQVFSAPPGIKWKTTDAGVQLVFDNAAEEGGARDALLGVARDIALSATNTADIANRIRVTALTGDNRISDAGDATINTGNAYAAANVMNLVNTNIIGQNWIWALLNIFGNWQGNIAFGRPNLWLGTRVEANGAPPLGPNKTVTYHYTIFNAGDADATKVALENRFNPRHIAFESDDRSTWDHNGRVVWRIGTIPAGEAMDVAYQGIVQTALPEGLTAIDATAAVVGLETDDDDSDNTDSVTIAARGMARNTGYGGYSLTLTPDPKLEIIIMHHATTSLYAPIGVDYSIVIHNNGSGSAYNAVLTGTISDESGQIVETKEWPLGEIFAGEEIMVDYTALFNKKTRPGVYANAARLTAISGHPSVNPFYGYFADATDATTTIVIAKSLPLPRVAAPQKPAEPETGPTAPATPLTAPNELIPAQSKPTPPETPNRHASPRPLAVDELLSARGIAADLARAAREIRDLVTTFASF